MISYRERRALSHKYPEHHGHRIGERLPRTGAQVAIRCGCGEELSISDKESSVDEPAETT